MFILIVLRHLLIGLLLLALHEAEAGMLSDAVLTRHDLIKPEVDEEPCYDVDDESCPSGFVWEPSAVEDCYT